MYLLRCSDGTLYCGATNDVERRVEQHSSGKGARYTRGRGPVELVAAECFPNKSWAMRAEAMIKRKPAGRKLDRLRGLARKAAQEVAEGGLAAGENGNGLDICASSDHEAPSGMGRAPVMTAKKVPDKYLRPFSKEEINSLPLRQFDGEIRLIKKKAEVVEAVEHLRAENVIGFDTESKPSFKKGCMHPPALLQLANSSAVYLFQLNCMPFVKELRELLADVSVVKTGVAVWDDIKGLQRLREFTDAGFMDLGDLSRELGMRTNGLRNLAANLLGFRISKSAQRSNWGRHRLSTQQIAYAATDAWVSRELHLRMEELKLLPANGNGSGGNGNGDNASRGNGSGNEFCS